MLDKVRKMLAEQLNISVDKITPESRVIEDLGADSLDVVEMLLDLEEEFGVQFQSEEMKNYRTVEDLYNAINEKLENK